MNRTVESLFPTPKILSTLLEKQSKNQAIYLVGGAVRDLLMLRDGHDLDFVAEGDVLKLARSIADEIGAAFYVMDSERQTARLIFSASDGRRWHLDFSAIRGADIYADLAARDFTINALAISLNQLNKLIDPLGGRMDIRHKIVRICSDTSFSDDPLRVLRAIRLSAELEFQITKDTIQAIKIEIPRLSDISVERQRDELFYILGGKNAVSGIRAGFMLGALNDILPHVAALKGEIQSAPHIHDVFDHTLALLDALRNLFDLLVEPFQAERGANLIYGMAVMELGRFRTQLSQHFSQVIHSDRSLFSLMMLAGLLHDTAKPFVRTIDVNGNMHFFNHDNLGADIAAQCGKSLALSTAEVVRLSLLIKNHMRIHHLAKGAPEVSRRSIYRYFHELNDSGVDLVLLSLADKLATYGVTITPAEWQKELSIARQLLDAWFTHKAEYLQPERLVSGTDLINELHIEPGKQIGDLLEAIVEAQAVGQISNREEALSLAGELLNKLNEV